MGIIVNVTKAAWIGIGPNDQLSEEKPYGPKTNAPEVGAHGDLTLHGVTRPVMWEVTARLDGQNLTGTATTNFTFADFNLTVPQVFVVLSVDETIRLEVDFQFVRS